MTNATPGSLAGVHAESVQFQGHGSKIHDIAVGGWSIVEHFLPRLNLAEVRPHRRSADVTMSLPCMSAVEVKLEMRSEG